DALQQPLSPRHAVSLTKLSDIYLCRNAYGIVTTVKSCFGLHWHASRFPDLKICRCRNFSRQVGGETAFAGSPVRRNTAQAIPEQVPFPAQGYAAANPRCNTMRAFPAASQIVPPSGT